MAHISSQTSKPSKAVEPDPPQGWRILSVLGSLMAFASISTDLYLPAMPAMRADLHAGPGSIEFTVSGFLVGFSASQLFWGPMGDRYGRKLPIAIGLVLFAAGSAGCALSGTPEALIFWRVIQAIGACAGVVLARAMVRDLYTGPKGAQMISMLLTIMAVAPLVGPTVGGGILAFAGWRAIFWALVGVGIITLLALMTLPETLPEEQRTHGSLIDSMKSYGPLLLDRKLVSFAAAGGSFYAGLYANVAASPFIYINYYHVPEQFYGAFFASGMVGMMIMNQINMRLVLKFRGSHLLKVGTVGAAISGILLALVTWTGWGGMWAMAALLFVFVAWFGLITTNSISGAMADFPNRAGSASALVGAAQYGFGMIGATVVGLVADGTPRFFGIVLAISGIGSFLFTLMARDKP